VTHRPELDAWDRQRYARHLLLSEVGEAGQAKLKAASVLCVGAGGLGSPALMYLAAAGVGRIGVVDFDVVDTSNLQRQIIHSDASVGQPKVDSAKARIEEINPRCTVDTHTARLTSANALQTLAPYDLVIDGTDNFPTRYLLNDAAVLLGKPYVYGAIFKFEGQASVFNLNGGPNYRDLFPVPPPPGSVPSCGEAGVLGVLPGIIGCIQATEALKIILGTGDALSGRLLLFNALDMRFREMSFQARPDAPAITELIDYEQFCRGGTPEAFERMDVTAIRHARAQGWSPFVLDVRTGAEAAEDRLDWADAQIPHDEVGERLAEIPKDRDVLVHCKRGGRSAQAAQVLARSGWARVVSMEGGLDDWRASHRQG
jgi:molybdopterin/thiamine biosynthesis adenylyltransferase/rhodanese-related sulfurtransferase